MVYHTFQHCSIKSSVYGYSSGKSFNLLMMKERKMVDKYGQKGKCWSRFMKFCMEKGTLIIPPSIKNGEFFKSHIKQAIDNALKYKLSDTDTCGELTIYI